ncbi:Hypothetical predicted protein, partial [Pelobates cultripes]
MRDAAGQLHHMPDQIAAAITRFYTDLYAIPSHQTKLSPDAAEALEAPLTEGELALAIKDSKT